ncbi:hypothetical protein HD806DRAFT_116417 [Xylariaceae sp. AK1471]|nr:hypothetical protein HD806DRAFT_116417 [Xylariaceae sp. AK1471]
MEFVVNRNDNIVVLGNVVAKAGSELSSPVQGIPYRGKAAASKCRNTNSTTGSTVSTSDRHQHKRSGAVAEALSSDSRLVSSPSLPSNVPEQPSPRTPELDSGDLYVPSTPGEINAQTLEDLASAGGEVVVRLLSFAIGELKLWTPALFGFVSLAQLVDARGNKNISAVPISLQDYSIKE